MTGEDLDEVDEGILEALQRDARNTTAAEIADSVGVTANTVRNRIERLEERGVITGYDPKIDFEEAGYQLSVSIRCTAPVPERTDLARAALEIDGVVSVRELMTGRKNLELTVVADENEAVTQVAMQVHELGLEIEDEELIKRDHSQPFAHFGTDETAD